MSPSGIRKHTKKTAGLGILLVHLFIGSFIHSCQGFPLPSPHHLEAPFFLKHARVRAHTHAHPTSHLTSFPLDCHQPDAIWLLLIMYWPGRKEGQRSRMWAREPVLLEEAKPKQNRNNTFCFCCSAKNMFRFSIVLHHKMHLLCFALTDIVASATWPLLWAQELCLRLPQSGLLRLPPQPSPASGALRLGSGHCGGGLHCW